MNYYWIIWGLYLIIYIFKLFYWYAACSKRNGSNSFNQLFLKEQARMSVLIVLCIVISKFGFYSLATLLILIQLFVILWQSIAGRVNFLMSKKSIDF